MLRARDTKPPQGAGSCSFDDHVLICLPMIIEAWPVKETSER